MITYQQESIQVIFDEGTELLKVHYKELARNRDRIKLNPDIDRYLAMEEADILVVVTARDGGKLIGYAVFAVTPALHYQDHLYAINDVLFLSHDYRGNNVGLDLLEIAEGILYKRGVSVIFIASKLNTKLSGILPRIGYTHVENNHSKYIGKK